ncbi:hypothetical protein [Nocardioides jiangxiensis]|uniref:Uncharacterized protein n=1 Tax=Nocardioides jiangxiensis TaxID=3064524 RepID=A0ABT9B0S1_9ACTN|nr:hypothetical protein [Nocardioides sp. WY-20]MDO7868312.1 hypothetical protein [Nocardioides sp. WY-20]
MRIALTALAVTGSLTLAACASEGTTADPTQAPTMSSSGSTSETAAPAKVIDITVKDGKVTPNGATIKVPVGKPIELRVTSDASGELHIHTTPAQALNYTPGTHSTTITIPRPGRVEAELEETGTLVANLDAE